MYQKLESKNVDYVWIIPPKEYPGKKYSNLYCLEHHYIWWLNTKELVEANKEVIHHKNGNKKDNEFKNLEKISLNEHNKKHRSGITYCEFICPFCGSIFKRQRNHSSLVKKTNLDFCSRSCGVTFYRRKMTPKKEGYLLRIFKN